MFDTGSLVVGRKFMMFKLSNSIVGVNGVSEYCIET